MYEYSILGFLVGLECDGCVFLMRLLTLVFNFTKLIFYFLFISFLISLFFLCYLCFLSLFLLSPSVLRIVTPKVNPNASFFGGPDFIPSILSAEQKEAYAEPVKKKQREKKPLAYSRQEGEFLNSAFF